MSAVVFLGPTLARDEGAALLDATWLPPAAQGDLYRAVRRLRPRVVVLIDGVYQHAPAVWHKEILWALEQGVHVFGAASMGALRAAELEPFGMRGVGVVFEAYRDGRLAPTGAVPFEDDDEVAVLHGPAETGFLALSEALVNMRCTLARAGAEGVLTTEQRGRLVELARGLFFQKRTWPELLAGARAAGVPPEACARLDGWLPSGRVDVKRADALAALQAAAAFLADDPAPGRPTFRLAPTSMWAEAVAAAEAAPFPSEAFTLEERVLDEVRLDPDGFRPLLWAALLADELEAAQPEVTPAAARETLAGLRRRFGLADRRALESWLVDNDLDTRGLGRLVELGARLDAAGEGALPRLAERLLDVLRLTGRYPDLRARAVAKGEPAPEDDLGGPRDIVALGWYFEARLDRDVPDDLDGWARAHGFADESAFLRALRREFGHAGRTRQTDATEVE